MTSSKGREKKITRPGAICFDCAKKYGKLPKYAIGVWEDYCSICAEKKSCADASHDFQVFEFPETKPSQQECPHNLYKCMLCKIIVSQPPQSGDEIKHKILKLSKKACRTKMGSYDFLNELDKLLK